MCTSLLDMEQAIEICYVVTLVMRCTRTAHKTSSLALLGASFALQFHFGFALSELWLPPGFSVACSISA